MRRHQVLATQTASKLRAVGASTICPTMGVLEITWARGRSHTNNTRIAYKIASPGVRSEHSSRASTRLGMRGGHIPRCALHGTSARHAAAALQPPATFKMRG